jgi:hypothetical protein
MALKIPASHRTALEELISSGQAPRLAKELASLDDLSDQEEIAEKLSSSTGLSGNLITRVIGAAGSMVLTRISREIETTEFVDDVFEQLFQSKDQDGPSQETIGDAKSAFSEMLGLTALETVAKMAVLMRKN